MVCGLDPTMPVIADADTGFGGPAMVARTVTQYARVGVAGLHIEDQVQTKRCGHLLGKQVVSREEFLTRIRAAVTARDAIPGGSDFVRTSANLQYIILLTFRLGYHWQNRFCPSPWYGGSCHPSQARRRRRRRCVLY